MDYFIGKYVGSTLDLPEESVYISLGNYYLYNDEYTTGYFLEEATHLICNRLKISRESTMIVYEDSKEVYIIFFVEGKKKDSIIYTKKDFSDENAYTFIMDSLKNSHTINLDFKIIKNGSKIVAYIPNKNGEFDEHTFSIKELNVKIFKPKSDMIKDFISSYLKVLFPLILLLVISSSSIYFLNKYAKKYLHDKVDVIITKQESNIKEKKKIIKNSKAKINLILKHEKKYRDEYDIFKKDPKRFMDKIENMFTRYNNNGDSDSLDTMHSKEVEKASDQPIPIPTLNLPKP
jgi:hypothetical protein